MLLKWMSGTIVSVILAILLIGLAGILLPAFHYLPAVGGDSFNLLPFKALLANKEVLSSLKLTIVSGLLSSLFTVIIAFSTICLFYQSKIFIWIKGLLAPVLAIPHAALAIGLIFLISPSGWILRLISPELSGFERPPNWITVQDPYALSLIVALLIKEVPYLLFVMLAVLDSLRVDDYSRIGKSLGYSQIMIWKKLIFPQLYPMIRLPIFIILAFSLTVVDLAILIGPNTPSTFAVTLFRWFNDPDLETRFIASAGAMLLLLLVVICCLFWELVYRCLQVLFRHSWSNGIRDTYLHPLIYSGGVLYLISCLLTLFSFIVLPLWVFARRWRFPDTFPSEWTLTNVSQHVQTILSLTYASLMIGLTSALFSLVLSVVLLEAKRKKPSNMTRLLDRMIYLPILLPQVGFLFGLQITLIWSGMSGHYPALILFHTLFVLPYVYLTLHGPYLAFNQNYYTQAILLQPSSIKALFMVKLAMLKPILFNAFAIGFAVSFAQYLPTLVAGEGRITTLTTEAIALASSGERKQVSVLALLQAILPLLMFIMAIYFPKYWTQIRINVCRFIGIKMVGFRVLMAKITGKKHA